MGRKIISQMTFFDFVVAITIGAVAAVQALGKENSILGTITSMLTFTILVLITDYLHIKSLFFRKLVDAKPVMIIENGKIVDANMKRARYNLNDLMMRLREKDIFNIADVEFAVMETDGELSVLPKSDKRPATPSDLKIPVKYTGLTRDLIVDGNVLTDNLKYVNLDEKWLNDQLCRQGITNISDVFYAGLDSSNNIYVSKKQQIKNIDQGKYGLE
jgi:uncharacterized membrane protein YcaP (DUF421 family)